MNILFALIPLSFVLLLLGVWAFFWAVNHDQFDDLQSPALAPLLGERAADPVQPQPPGDS